MAKELVRGAGQAIVAKGANAIKKHAKKAAKKHAEKKHAAKKQAKKAAKHAHDSATDSKQIEGGPTSAELQRAFHHLQRASAVISLIEAESGGDLKVLLHHGIELYREAFAGGAKQKARAAAGLLRAAEHLALAGLYAARGVHQLSVEEPSSEDIEALAASIGSRLGKIKPRKEYGLRLHAMVFELVKRAEGADHDPHLAWELVHGADGVCVALEIGLD